MNNLLTESLNSNGINKLEKVFNLLGGHMHEKALTWVLIKNTAELLTGNKDSYYCKPLENKAITLQVHSQRTWMLIRTLYERYFSLFSSNRMGWLTWGDLILPNWKKRLPRSFDTVGLVFFDGCLCD